MISLCIHAASHWLISNVGAECVNCTRFWPEERWMGHPCLIATLQTDSSIPLRLRRVDKWPVGSQQGCLGMSLVEV
jgi:hypothetical protein